MGTDDIERFASHGGNSIRTWSTLNDGTQELLDKAHAHGVTVSLGLPVRAERHGMDYDDPEAVAQQLELVRAEVLKYKDHPAVLTWLIGNELNHSYTNPAVWDAVNDIAKMIHEEDPNHPVSSTLAGFNADVVADIMARAPDLDFFSFQDYGSLFGLPHHMETTGFDKPFMVTEWGTIGYWEMEQTDWGAPVELTSSEKADKILEAHNDVLEGFGEQLDRLLRVLLGPETGANTYLVWPADGQRRGNRDGRRHALHLERDVARQSDPANQCGFTRRQKSPG